MTETWNLASVWESIADEVGDEPALIHGDRIVCWADFDDRAARLATVLATHGVGQDSKVALYLFNSPAYLEATFAAF